MLPKEPGAAKPPLVSIVMAHRNGEHYLAEAIASVMAQTIEDLELILCDDGSTDSSVAVAKQIAERDPRLRVVTAAVSSGPATARNRGLSLARGQWIAVVDSDDLLHPDRLERLLARAEVLGADGIADDLIYFGGETGRSLLGPMGLDGPLELTPECLLKGGPRGAGPVLGYLKPVIRREALAGMFYRESLRIGEDFDLLLRIALSGAKMFAVPEPTYLYRRHASSISYRLAPMDVEAMIAAYNRIREDFRLSPELERAVEHRQSKLLSELEFARLVATAKEKKLGRASGQLLHSPELVVPLARSAREGVTRRVRQRTTGEQPEFVALAESGADIPPGYRRFEISGRVPARAEAVRLAALGNEDLLELHAEGRAGLAALTHVPGWRNAVLLPPADGWSAREEAAIRSLPWTVTDMSRPVVPGRVQVRTPTYKRPESLERCLRSLQDQTHTDWVCDVYDDDRGRSGEAVVRRMNDPRIRYHLNPKQNFASKNIDRCFTRANPNRAEFFCVLEDDNLMLTSFMEENILAARAHGVNIVFRNQLIEHEAESEGAYFSERGILDDKLTERVYSPEHFRLALISDIGVSNGGLFWSHKAVSDLEVHFDCSATFQEYLRTFAIEDPIFVAMEPLAVWALNGESTTRDLGATAGWFRRELRLKHSIAKLQHTAWRLASPEQRQGYLRDMSFLYPQDDRERGLTKSLLSVRWKNGSLGATEKARLLLRGSLIRLLGRPEPALTPFLQRRPGVSATPPKM
ncbi:glycosyltransferase [Pseudoruegeria sp. HB172150]|uniref:glycosyltransferase family 2 protein n=1 Tax=Pseudoruegeria sp. HB172150 TaxID=2721164 RepID=UPI001555D8E4|nr:glycosyltransferase [Pseudoruegeria sp. HB172150]